MLYPVELMGDTTVQLNTYSYQLYEKKKWSVMQYSNLRLNLMTPKPITYSYQLHEKKK
ncbi:MAG: hypothetical protein OCD00_00185 [Colwellia sp.]